MDTRSGSLRAESESPIKHTPAGEMPDASRTSEASRRILAAAPVASEFFRSRSFLISLAAVGLGTVAYFLARNINQRNSSEQNSR